MSDEQRIARLEMSERFLNLLVSKSSDGDLKTTSDVSAVLHIFREENAGIGDDFDLAHTWRIAELRTSLNNCMVEKGDLLPSDAVELEIVLKLLEDAVFNKDAQP